MCRCLYLYSGEVFHEAKIIAAKRENWGAFREEELQDGRVRTAVSVDYFGIHFILGWILLKGK